jgi:hypothetical protein
VHRLQVVFNTKGWRWSCSCGRAPVRPSSNPSFAKKKKKSKNKHHYSFSNQKIKGHWSILQFLIYTDLNTRTTYTVFVLFFFMKMGKILEAKMWDDHYGRGPVWHISCSDLRRSHCKGIKYSMHIREWPGLDFCPSSVGSSWLVTPIVSLFAGAASGDLVLWFGFCFLFLLICFSLFFFHFLFYCFIYFRVFLVLFSFLG